MNENTVRNQLTAWAGDKVLWSEYATGGSVGNADAMVVLGSKSIPFELKWWNVSLAMNNGATLETKVRPAQRMWHLTRHSQGIKTAFLIGFTWPRKKRASMGVPVMPPIPPDAILPRLGLGVAAATGALGAAVAAACLPACSGPTAARVSLAKQSLTVKTRDFKWSQRLWCLTDEMIDGRPIFAVFRGCDVPLHERNCAFDLWMVSSLKEMELWAETVL